MTDDLIERLVAGNSRPGFNLAMIEAAEELTRLRAKIASISHVRDGYADQSKFCDIEAMGYFREFIRRIDASLGELGSRDQAPHPSASSMQTAIETGNRALPVQTRLAAIDTPAPLECPDDWAALRIATREFTDAVIEALRIPKMLDWLTARLR